MVTLTILGRSVDGMPVASSRDFDNSDGSLSPYTEQAELLLKEIAARWWEDCMDMTVLVDDDHYFQCMAGNGMCYIALLDSSYPRKLAFYYLRDLEKEVEKFVGEKVLESVATPYALKRLGYVIEKVRRRYVDSRTQSNLSKLNSVQNKDLGILVEEISKIMNKKLEESDLDSVSILPEITADISSHSKLFEEIALKWIPVTIVGTSINLREGTSTM